MAAMAAAHAVAADRLAELCSILAEAATSEIVSQPAVSAALAAGTRFRQAAAVFVARHPARHRMSASMRAAEATQAARIKVALLDALWMDSILAPVLGRQTPAMPATVAAELLDYALSAGDGWAALLTRAAAEAQTALVAQIFGEEADREFGPEAERQLAEAEGRVAAAEAAGV
jgi:hypothetical protein